MNPEVRALAEAQAAEDRELALALVMRARNLQMALDAMGVGKRKINLAIIPKSKRRKR